MKKLIALLLCLAMTASLCSCTALKEVEGDKKSEQSTSAPSAQPEQTESSEPRPAESYPVLESLGGQILVSIENNEEIHKAPDGSDQTILTFAYDTVTVHVEGNDRASERINNSLGVLEETFYSGTGMGDGMGNGLNGMLELATDNYTVAMETGDDRSLEFSSARTAFVRRSDKSLLSLVYQTQVYTGGAHGIYHERAYLFDSQTGDRLTLALLCGSSEKLDAFKAYAVDKMVKEAKNEDSGVDLSLFDDDAALKEALGNLIRETSWFLDGDGLVFFSDIYEIGSYAAGIIRFRFSYDELKDYIDEKWLPTQREESGYLSVDYVNDLPDGSTTILDRVVIDPEGEELCLTVSGTVYDLTVVSVGYISDDVGFYETAQHWSCSYMHDASLQIVTVLPEGMPDVMIRYTDAAGTTHSVVVTQSGEDGSLILVDDDIQAIG